jgi:hypothetical protein
MLIKLLACIYIYTYSNTDNFLACGVYDLYATIYIYIYMCVEDFSMFVVLFSSRLLNAEIHFWRIINASKIMPRKFKIGVRKNSYETTFGCEVGFFFCFFYFFLCSGLVLTQMKNMFLRLLNYM